MIWKGISSSSYLLPDDSFCIPIVWNCKNEIFLIFFQFLIMSFWTNFFINPPGINPRKTCPDTPDRSSYVPQFGWRHKTSSFNGPRFWNTIKSFEKSEIDKIQESEMVKTRLFMNRGVKHSVLTITWPVRRIYIEVELWFSFMNTHVNNPVWISIHEKLPKFEIF